MEKLRLKANLGTSSLRVPPVIFGTSCLGNLYQALPWETKLAIVREMFTHVEPPVILDTAGKYGAGMALEVIGKCLSELGIAEEDVLISNKLGWVQAPLLTPEPQFERGVWADLEHDAEQKISHDGILECWEQGCRLLGGRYRPRIVSVHDPDEYLGQARDEDDRQKRWDDILGAYTALTELKDQGKATAVGVGSKDWRVIRDLDLAVDLDWVMLAVSMTIMNHPPELMDFIHHLRQKGVGIINSAVFHAGFLTGGRFFDYREVSRDRQQDAHLFRWRDSFFDVCERFNVDPAEACVQFAISPPGVVSIALNTSKPQRVADNVKAVQANIPTAFWEAIKTEGLVAGEYPHLP